MNSEGPLMFVGQRDCNFELVGFDLRVRRIGGIYSCGDVRIRGKAAWTRMMGYILGCSGPTSECQVYVGREGASLIAQRGAWAVMIAGREQHNSQIF
jgi:hypothetical protein